jgi:hypothetical protein
MMKDCVVVALGEPREALIGVANGLEAAMDCFMRILFVAAHGQL